VIEMLVRDKIHEIMATIPRLAQDETFCFGCHTDVPCLNKCCLDQNIPLTPYDVVRLRSCLDLGSDPFLQQYTIVEKNSNVGIIMVHLKMEGEDPHQCPFVTESGCGVYEHRPSACRTFPMGRAIIVAADGSKAREEYVLLHLPICKGFEAGTQEFTASSYVASQGLDIYHQFNNRYSKLLSRWQIHGISDDSQLKTLLFTALYRVDIFAEIIEQQQLLESSGAPERLHEKILSDEPQRLWFAYKYIEGLS
jgi:Fe-S-cluster containining protein